MVTSTLDDIGDCSLATMRVIGETLQYNLQSSVFDSDAEGDIMSTHCTLADMEVIKHEERGQVS
jgi:hypothetical protein